MSLASKPIHQYHSNKSGKNSSDIRLAIEAIDLLYNNPIDTFVIVSSDSDFVPLVGKLRSSGKSVIVAGRREGDFAHANQELRPLHLPRHCGKAADIALFQPVAPQKLPPERQTNIFRFQS